MPRSTFEELIERKNRGSLKIYLSYAPGTGKTYDMLAEGRRLAQLGLDAIIGFVDARDREDTLESIQSLPVIQKRMIVVDGYSVPEMDVAAILKRKPQIVLIDELAHTNAKGSQHAKRYEDVIEILANGINVISTLNVQHLESVADRVEQATQMSIPDRLPDWVLRKADQIVLVDVSIEELRERLRAGKVYPIQEAEKALQTFFTYENLSFLREISLREVAGDQVRKIEEKGLLPKGVSDIAEEAVMVAMSADPTYAEVLIRKATRLANQLSTRCYVVYIQKKRESPIQINSELQKKLDTNLKLATTLGAEVVTIRGENVAEALTTFASEKHVKHAVFGKSRKTLLWERLTGSLILEFLHDSVGIDVHIVTTTGENL